MIFAGVSAQVTFPVKESILCPICLSQVLEASVAEDGSPMVVAFAQSRPGQVPCHPHYPYILTARMVHASCTIICGFLTDICVRFGAI